MYWSGKRPKVSLSRTGTSPRKYRDKIDFVIVDLDHPSLSQRLLIARYYRGSIPTITVIDRKDEVLYNRAGETAATRSETSKLEALLNSAK